ncbi:hypothetical protein V7S43_007905 [Phytophthora oleae]|uniref:Uncharacterized protein n=1 Tax=Phytophthora oleae TaxID=2107226 RepID=A0ABD3FJK9_9STRA
MEKANTFELRVVFDSGAYFAYQNPSDTICYQLAGCPGWEPAMSVVLAKPSRALAHRLLPEQGLHQQGR